MSTGRIFIALFLALIAVSSIAQAQVITATIRGKVVDQQGGVLAGASVTARQVDTNLAKTVLTTDLGQFFLPSLPAGKYELNVTLSGFAPVNSHLS